MLINKKLALLAVFLSVSVLVFAKTSVQAFLDKDKISLGEYAKYKVIIKTDSRTEPRISFKPGFKNFLVGGYSYSSQMHLAKNGKNITEITIIYFISARKPGVFTLPQAIVTTSGSSIKGPLLKLKVAGSLDKIPKEKPAPAPFNPNEGISL